MGILNSLTNKIFKNNPVNLSNFNSISKDILNTKWDLTDDFEVIISNNYATYKFPDLSINSLIEKSVISVEVPPMSSQEQDNVIGGIRKPIVRMYEQFRFTIKFRETKGEIRDFFNALFVGQQYVFPKDIASDILVKSNGSVIFQAKKCMIIQISGINLDHNTTNVVEFDVTFISTDFTNSYIKDFGTDPDYASSFDNKRKEESKKQTDFLSKLYKV